MSKPKKPAAHTRAHYAFFSDVQTRWEDNDVYGHINNAVYYSYFDSAVNAYLIENDALNIHEGDEIGLVVESGCQYFSEIAYPEKIDIGLRVGHLGNSSVRYELALFAQDAERAAAQGFFTHVYVDRATRRPQTLSGNLRTALEGLLLQVADS
ncbi:Thioesterase superfamily protein [Pseudovibrio sp. Ad13]|uniref:acyl-CoA thioesterase n=1 Tax=unclassified Pseudovibrio TaxID=2627060 RepID=UPI0007AEB96F|nr:MULTISPECIES: thioesterase family protein [unclassified Pseudovibrio]KZK76038.1 Thioesterase superfamily protein [Pseudovibrio sp. Ad13]KZL03863.1 Thioesterase superfamily protein [Pseudovibrio sp. W74]KZL09743.1 Thioesterase superfamily protein [Pseudovibrio sp. Ad14]